jgi:putative ABC transport system ATP-binding protein
MIEITNLHKIYNQGSANEFEALNNINLTIDKKPLILKGISGSGKSTLLSLIAGFEKPTKGKIVVDDLLVSKLPDFHLSQYRASKIGFVFQHFNLIDSFSVLDNVIAPLIPLYKDISHIQKLAYKAMQRVGIEHKASQDIRDLSGGEKQRCAIARALINDAPIIICDEPTANLDSKNTQRFIDIITELKDEGKSIIIATHDPIFDSLDFECDIINLQNGKIKE